MKNKQVIVTTSWDDGHKLDLKLAKLLKKYNIKGTFYVSPNNREFKKEDLLTDKDIVELSKDFEIGAHTMTHPRLTKISLEEAKKEIVNSKKYLETLTGKKINSFCYPGGDYNKEIRDLVEEAGFKYARTVKQIATKFSKDYLQSNTSLHIFPLSIKGVLGEIKYSFNGEIKIMPLLLTKDWEVMAKRIFDYVLENGGVYHLWGHSWEIDKNEDWDKLEKLFNYIKDFENVNYLINSKLLEKYKK